MSASGTATGILLSLVATVVPTAVYVAIVWWCDRYEKEPLWLLASAFLWGALPAVAVSAFVELRIAGTLGLDIGEGLLGATVVAPVVEEVIKALALVSILVVARGELDDVLDGIVYGALVGFGFAMSENLLYYIGALGENGLAGWGLTVALRGILFGSTHAFFGALTGAAIGYAREKRTGAIRVLAPIGGLCLAIGFHTVHNLGAAMSTGTCVPLGLSLLFDTGGLVTVLVILWLALKRERRWLAEELHPEIGVLLTEQEYVTALSPSRRLAARIDRLTAEGWAASQREARFFATLTEYAFHRTRQRAGHGPSEAARAARMRERLLAMAATRRGVGSGGAG